MSFSILDNDHLIFNTAYTCGGPRSQTVTQTKTVTRLSDTSVVRDWARR